MIAILGIIYCLGAYLVFIKFRLIKFTLFWQIVVGIVGFFGLLTILYGTNYTQPFSIGGTVSGLTTQIEARVPGKVIEVNVKDNASVKKGDVLFRMDPQPYADELSQSLSRSGRSILAEQDFGRSIERNDDEKGPNALDDLPVDVRHIATT